MWKRIAFLLYPFLIGICLFLLVYRALLPISPAYAGQIRRAELSQDRPLIVRVAPGRTTVLSFSVRPEKVVPGNPQALEINFLSRDLTIRPLGAHPGNIIIYTKSARYVVLLQLTSESQYDDVVNISSANTRSKPLRLSEDTYRIEDWHLNYPLEKTDFSFMVLLHLSGKIIEAQELPSDLRCKNCIVKKQDSLIRISCTKEIQTLECRTSGKVARLERVKK